VKFTITDTMHPDLSFEEHESAGIGLDFASHRLRTAGPRELIAAVQDSDVVLIDQAKFDRQVVEGLARCRLLLRHGIGYDNVDVLACTERGIVVGYYPTFCVRDVAEQTVTLMMACRRRLTSQIDNLRRVDHGGYWDIPNVSPMHRIEHATIGIVGFGRIGRAVDALLRSFGVRILVSDPYLPADMRSALGDSLVDFEYLLGESDVVTVHVPFKDVPHDTFHMFDDAEFRLMKSTAILLNTSRGPVVNLDALDAALREGIIAGAGIDVYEQEPPPASLPLLGNPRAICTPHLAWYSQESTMSIRRFYMEDVRRFVAGELPVHQVNPEITRYRTIDAGSC
jgi:D-3-phosphoglycerate dehydrogenase / 2-oxoglutarate reductase